MADRDRPMRARDDAEGFLRRWSRRKAEARSAPAASPATDDATADAGPGAQAAPEATHETLRQDAPAPIDPKDLPDIATLDASSDFSVFMRPGVPAHLRTLALRKLWRSDPIFSKLDGLVEYGEDYTIPSWPKGAIKTAYRIGLGFVNELEKLEVAERPEQEALPEPAEEPPDEPAHIAVASPEPPPAEPVSPREPAPPQGHARPAVKRRGPLARS
jgi:Protein of unknown function (DUF3306)